MKYTEEQFALALSEAAKKCGLDSHIYYLKRKADMQTWADRVIGCCYRKGMPVKRSYMFCDALDMTFFFLPSGKAVYSYAGQDNQSDATEEKIVNAFRKANEMRIEMEKALERMSEKENENE